MDTMKLTISACADPDFTRSISCGTGAARIEPQSFSHTHSVRPGGALIPRAVAYVKPFRSLTRRTA